MKHSDILDKLGALLPGLRLFARYERDNLKPDLLSGLVVTLVLIPSAIAYADLAHAPPIASLYAALGGMIVFALLTSSRDLEERFMCPGLNKVKPGFRFRCAYQATLTNQDLI